MPNVVRFALSSARTMVVAGAGRFEQGYLDIDVNRVDAVAAARKVLPSYGATEVGIVDSAAAKPTLPLPADYQAPENADPYPQYLTPTELLDGNGKVLDSKLPARLSDAQLRAASVAAVFPSINTVGGLADFWQFPSTLYGATGVNAASFTQDAVTTAPNGDVYCVFWDGQRRPIIGRYSTTYRTWQVTDLSQIAGNPLASPVPADGHNVLSVAVDGDGYIHVSGNMHNVALRYIRSTNPNDISAWSAPGMVGTNEDSVTYPQFVRLTSGDLLFFYRNGLSGNGDHFVNRYTKSTKSWARAAQIFKGTSPVSPDESAYINRVALGSDGTLHLFYLWRPDDVPTTAHDISYIKSTDGAVTWTTATGTAMTLPLKPSDTAPVVRAGYTTDLVNQTGASVDSNGVPHAAWWLTPTPGTSELHHFYYSGGTWHDDIVTTLPFAATRPCLWSYQDKTWAIYSNGGRVTAIRLAPTVGTPHELFGVSVNQWEGGFDATAAARLRMVVTPSRSDLTQVWGGVLSLDPSVLDGFPADLVQPQPRAAPALTPTPAGNGQPMLPGYWYRPPGNVDNTTVAVVRSAYRAGIIKPARACTISQVAVRVTAPGGAGSTYRVVIYDVATTQLLASTAALDGTVTGIITAPLAFRLLQGQAVYVGVVTQGSDTVPSMGRLAGSQSPDVGALTSTQAMDNSNNYVGISATLGDGALPATLTVNLTTAIPLVALLVSA